MIPFETSNMVSGLNGLSRLFADISRTEALPDDEAKRRTDEVLRNVQRHLQKVPLPFPLRHQFKRMQFRANVTPFPRAEIGVLARELHENIVAEFTTRRFLMISDDKVPLIDQTEPLFGPEVHERYPDARFDIAAAGRCLALDEWTASVFHSMRVLELGLRDLARRLQVKMSKAFDQAQWNDLIVAIENEITARRTRPPRSLKPAQRRRLDWYSQMAANFRHFNQAWRTHVSHARGRYEEHEATEVWSNVRTFMQLLARGPS